MKQSVGVTPAAAIAAGAGIHDPHSILLPVAFRLMGMSVESCLGTHDSGLRHQLGSADFNAIFVAMGHKQPHTAYIITEAILHPRRTAVTVTVAGNLMQGNLRVTLLQCLTIVIVISQVHNRLGFDCLHTAAHEPHGRMRV